jgi:hypothetical protein
LNSEWEKVFACSEKGSYLLLDSWNEIEKNLNKEDYLRSKLEYYRGMYEDLKEKFE